MWILDNKIRDVKYTLSGIDIIFYSDTMYQLKDIFKIEYHKKNYYFEVTGIETLTDNHDATSVHLKFTAREIGYWTKKLDKLYERNCESRSELDIRELINITVEKVIDEEERISIVQEDSWL
ncbi:MAG: hypothetical protein Q4D02_00830 [Clostridia bacterium]|nr:hypothetical protein [Clostridia bacterium]